MVKKTCQLTFPYNPDGVLLFLSRFKGKHKARKRSCNGTKPDVLSREASRASRVSGVRDTLDAILFNDF